jgi:hypothetical protein
VFAFVGLGAQAVFVVGSVSRSNSRFDTHKDVVVPPARGPWTPTADALPLRLSDDDDRRTLLHFRGVLPGQGDLNPWGVRSTLAKVRGREPFSSVALRPSLRGQMEKIERR